MLDTIISTMSPRWAARRAIDRLRLHQANETLGMVRKYELGGNSRRTQGWNRPHTGPNRANEFQGGRLRASARDLVRNNGYASSAAAKLTGHVIGRGIVAQAVVPETLPSKQSAKLKLQATQRWRQWCKSPDLHGVENFAGLQRLVFRGIVEGGEVFLRWVVTSQGKLKVQILEAEYCDETLTRNAKGGGQIIQGIEFNAAGEKVAYWMHRQHPAESGHITVAPDRIPAAEIDHVFLPSRPGQVRGVSWFASSGLDLRDAEDIEQALLMRKKIEACLALLVRRDPLSDGVTLGSSEGNDANNNRLEGLAPGMVHYLGDSENVETLDPATSQDSVEFLQRMLYKASAAIGLPYHSMTGDVSRANYSSLRAAMLDFWVLLDQYQHHMLIPKLMQKAWDRVMSHGALNIPRLNEVEAKFTPPVRAFVDPKKDVEAAALEVRSGFASMQDKLTERGQDPFEQIEEFKDWNQRVDKAGVVLETDGRLQDVAQANSVDIEKIEEVTPTNA